MTVLEAAEEILKAAAELVQYRDITSHNGC